MSQSTVPAMAPVLPTSVGKTRPRKRRLSAARIGVYAFLFGAALFFLLPLYVMITTSFKTMDEIRIGSVLALPAQMTLDPWRSAWGQILIGAVNGYALSFWRPRFANLLFGVLMAGAFIPVQVMIYPLVWMMAKAGLFGSLPAIVLVHCIFGMPVMTLLFRNYYASVPHELFQAARIDGGGFWRIFAQVMLPMSLPIIVVAAIMQVTGVWNDYILGLVFAGRDNAPMTVQLNNVINTTTGTRLYNVNMAATILTAALPLAIYFLSGRWFVRGIAAGAVKG